MKIPRIRILPTARVGLLSALSYLRAPLPCAALAALALIPLLYSGLYLWSFWDPFGRMDRLPVALVNEDRPARADGETLHAGDDLVRELHEDGRLDWRDTDADDAAEGVADGRYYVALTIPEDFSANLASPSGAAEKPVPAMLEAQFNDANSYIVRELLGSAFKDVRTAAGRTAGSDYFDKMFLGFNDIHGQTEKAADGAHDLADGADDAKAGAHRLDTGLGGAKEGSSELRGGLKESYSGSKSLATGATKASKQVSDAVEKLDPIADDAIPTLRDDAPDIESGATAIADAADVLSDALDKLPEDSSAAAEHAGGVRDRIDDHLKRNPGLETEDPTLYKILTDARGTADEAARLNDFVQDNRDQIGTVGTKAAKVEKLAGAVAKEAPDAADDLEGAQKKVHDLNDGLKDLAKGNRELRDGLKTAYSGSKDLDDGIGDLHDGSGKLDDGLGTLKKGSHDLSDGLDDGLDQIPTYDADQRSTSRGMMSDPVRLADDVANPAPNYGTGFAPFFLPLSLWVGAMVTFMVLPTLSGRALAGAAPSWRVTLAGWLLPAVIGAAQVAAMLTALSFGLGLDAQRWAGLIGLLVLTAAAFTSVVHWLNAQFGAAGRVIALVLLMLQLTSSGGTYPLETSPPFFQAIGPYLPMHWVVMALRHLISGGQTAVVWQAAGVLGCYLVGSLLLTWVAVARKRTWTMGALHPSLTL
ncbi:putative membrane protein [Murinocardiopsis flavida]|uniref:Putative membrane protein n=1 Tax=Murinocardiopsis flavida TaxID=645275 RepID=A0A2P8DJ35_9ACTN|nr:YhgE/Pip domain-containing protein [Murinocardiopsis flavida]PSK97179.1 putative membrane protein [Murinocardiopsis flavida]